MILFIVLLLKIINKIVNLFQNAIVTVRFIRYKIMVILFLVGSIEMQSQQKMLKAVEDLNARLITEEKALEQAQQNKKQMQAEKEVLATQLAVTDRKHGLDIRRKLTALDKRFRFQCELEERHRLQIDQINIKQKKINDNFSTLADMGQSSSFADALFSFVHHVDEQRIAENAASRASISIHRLVITAAKLTPKGKERFSRYVRLNGIAKAKTKIVAPATRQKAACYETTVNLILEDGTETLVWHDECFDALCIKDKRTSDKLNVDADGYGTRLHMDTLLDSVLRADELPKAIKDKIELPSQILEYHVIEKAILPDSAIHIEGEVYINHTPESSSRNKDVLHMRRVFDRAHTPIVTTQTEKELKKPRRQRIMVSIIIGAVFLTFAVIILVSSLT